MAENRLRLQCRFFGVKERAAGFTAFAFACDRNSSQTFSTIRQKAFAT
jgi:hypothetical protein